jgi:hypothetical protein
VFYPTNTIIYESEKENMNKVIYIGTDGGATTSKVGGVWSDGSTISTKLLQSSTNSASGLNIVQLGQAITNYLSINSLTWNKLVGGAGSPGRWRYGVFDHSRTADSLPVSMCIPLIAMHYPNAPGAPSH